MKKRMDSVIANAEWFIDLPNVMVICFRGLDHCPIILDLGLNSKNITSSFRFEPNWNNDSKCGSLISDSWNTQLWGSLKFQTLFKINIGKQDLLK